MIIVKIKAQHHPYQMKYIRKSQVQLKRIRNSYLVIIDDLIYMAMDQRDAKNFHLIIQLYEHTSNNSSNQ